MNLIDSIDAFLQWYSLSVNLTNEEKIASFRKIVISKDPAFYSYRKSLYDKKNQNFDDEVIKTHNEFNSIKERFILAHQNLQMNIDKGFKKLKMFFPEFDINIPFHVCHSFRLCDGGAKMINEEMVLVIGIDMIAKLHDWDNDIPFVQHELFHIYHLQIFHPNNNSPYNEEALYNALWIEGLATYVSHILNPDVSNAELLLDIPKNMVQDVENQFSLLVKELLDNLYSSDPEILKKFFLLTGKASFPERSGYYIGYLVIKEMAKSYRLDHLVSLKEEQFIPEFDKILSKMAKN